MIRMRYAILLLTAAVIALGSAVAIASAVQPSTRQSTKRQRVTTAPATPTRADTSCSDSKSRKQQDRPAVPGAGAEVRFATITVSINPKGTPLAAYQFELTAGHAFTVVGLDNGGNASFPDAPHYDRSANADATDRLIVADYSTAGPGQLITKPYPVATIHAAFTLDANTDAEQLAASLELTLTAAADADGNPIDADITYDLHFPERPGQE